jgi:hypothetical protein
LGDVGHSNVALPSNVLKPQRVSGAYLKR